MIGEVKPHVLDMAFAITSFFETNGRMDAVTGNFDGQILSVGALQWNIRQGTLQPLILKSHEENPLLFQEIFGAAADLVLQAAQSNHIPTFLAMLENDRLKPTWRRIWSRWASAFADLQKTVGAQPYFQKAYKIVTTLKLASARSFCWAFDLAVQNGGMGRLMAEALRIVTLVSEDEREALRRLTELRGTLVRKQFLTDYLSRKLAIVYGRGIVRGAPLDLEKKFNLSDDPWRLDPAPQD